MLSLAGFEVRAFDGAEAALAALDDGFDGPVVTDIRMPRMNGLQLFERIKALDPELPVLLVTGHADVELAVAALKDGVYDFISKPFDGERLATAVAHAAEKRRLVLENRRLRAAAAEAPADLPLIGDAPAIRRLRETDPPGRRGRRRRAGPRRDRLGQGGGRAPAASTGAGAGRRTSSRSTAARCPRPCSRASSSATRPARSPAPTAAASGGSSTPNGGTLFLDEIESCPPAIQVKLLRVLETREVEPLGTNERRRLDLRVVAATKVDLGDPARARRLPRGSLLSAERRHPAHPAAARAARRHPAPLRAFPARSAERFGRPAPEIDGAVRDHLARHDWPGNVRELLHFADRVALGLEAEPRASAPPPCPPDSRTGACPSAWTATRPS